MSPSAKAIFVTGTDTGVGKTMVTAALAAALVRRGKTVAVYKPVETGCSAASKSSQLIAADATYLKSISGCVASMDQINPYRFALPLAPSVAAQAENKSIDIDLIVEQFRRLETDYDIVLVEGAGGLLVPVTDHYLIIDLIKRLEIPALVVGRSTLGTINHCLLTLEALTHRSIPVAGLVLSRQAKRPAPEEAANPYEIERAAGDVICGVLPFFSTQQRCDAGYLAERCEVHLDIDRIFADHIS